MFDVVPGPGLAAQLGVVEVAGLSDAEVLDYVAACDRLEAWVAARRMVAMATFAHRGDAEGLGIFPLPRPADPELLGAGLPDITSTTTSEEADNCRTWADTELATARVMTMTAAGGDLFVAEVLTSHGPRVWRELSLGRVSPYKAGIVAATLAAHVEVAGQIQDRIVPRLAGLTSAQLRKALRRIVLTVDPATTQEQVAQRDGSGACGGGRCRTGWGSWKLCCLPASWPR